MPNMHPLLGKSCSQSTFNISTFLSQIRMNSDESAFGIELTENRVEATRLPPHQATRQGSSSSSSSSLFNLTMNNNNPFNHLGKPSTITNMNLDDYLKNIPTKDDKMGIEIDKNNASSCCSSSSSSSSPQSSASVNLNRTISNKPVYDEVWKDILQQSHCTLTGDNGPIQLEPTAGGETTTLEEFLVQTGAINIVENQEIVVNPLPLGDPIAPLSQHQPDWLQLQMNAIQPGAMGCLGVPGLLFGNPPMDNDNQLGFSMPMDGTTSSDSQAINIERNQRGYSDEMLEKTIERRQKRMIKNRESAARSRAKKQAHNNNLQYQGSQLQIMNNRLMKEKDIFLRLDPDPQPKFQLRRTSSALL